jgi:hypothetical protein
MKKLFLTYILIISSLSAFTREKEVAPVEISVDEALKSCVGGPPQPSITSIKTTDLKELDEISVDEALKSRIGCPHAIKTTDLKELDEISVDEALKSRIGCPHAIKTTGLKEGDFKYVLDGRIIDKKDFGDIDIKDIKGMELVATNTYYDYIFIRTKKGSRLSKQIPKTMKELGVSEYNYREHKYKIDK